MRLLISESEKNRILAMHNKVRSLLFEQDEQINAVQDWEVAKKDWSSQTVNEVNKTGKSPDGVTPPYEWALQSGYDENGKIYYVITSDGKAWTQESPDFDLTSPKKLEGTWYYHQVPSNNEDSGVYFSWMGDRPKPEYNQVVDYLVDYLNHKNQKYGQSKGLGGYHSIFIEPTNNNPNQTQFREDGKYFIKKNDTVIKSGYWTWNGSKLIYDGNNEKIKTSILTQEDGPATQEGMYRAILDRNKIGKIGAEGPVVKYIQHKLTPEGSDNAGTGIGCGSNIEKCDGKYGPKTKSLVINWQKKNDLSPDGIFGKKSANMLK
jgi:hypothetical protein